MKKIIYTALLSLGVSQVAIGQTATGFESVNEVSISGSGNIRVVLSGAPVNPADCPQTDYLITPDSTSRNFWLAQLMTAKAAEQTVRIRLNPSQCGNGGNSPRITQVEVR